jgi:hypothetical protein
MAGSIVGKSCFKRVSSMHEHTFGIRLADYYAARCVKCVSSLKVIIVYDAHRCHNADIIICFVMQSQVFRSA